MSDTIVKEQKVSLTGEEVHGDVVDTGYNPIALSPEDKVRRDVYGLTYLEAKQQCDLLTQEIIQRANLGFASMAECAKWAHDHILDRLLYSPSTHKFFNVSHKGEVITDVTFQQYYGSILFYLEGDKGKHVTWMPNSFVYYDHASIPAEQSDGVHTPMYYRSYVVPTGYYNAEKGVFNIAKPFPVFAKETGRDTSHIYKLIDHIAGECSMWLLAWLRAKMMYPTSKTQVIPIIVSRAQGSGKTTFAEVICKGLFGRENVIVSDQYDATARFNSDYADALIVCQEEKEETDKRNPAGTLKSRATATTIRKELKGIDPIYQESYTDFIMTTNKDVPVKFDGREDQRRFMVMEADDSFTRKTSAEANEVFTKLYGYDENFNRVGTPFVNDVDLIAQFKHELYTNQAIAAVNLRAFPKTAAYKRCFTLPRTTEATEIESILRALAPFILATLKQDKLVLELGEDKLEDVVQVMAAVRLVPKFKDRCKYVALCRPLVFYDNDTHKAFQHSIVERAIYDNAVWLKQDYGLEVIPDMEPLPGGFPGVPGRYKMAPSAKICLVEEAPDRGTHVTEPVKVSVDKPSVRQGERFRVNDKFRPDPNGCFETVNEMKPGTDSLKNKTDNVQYMDTFLLESDDVSSMYRSIEERRMADFLCGKGPRQMTAEKLYTERLSVQKSEALRLFNAGTVCRVVYSGAKSMHLLVRVDDSPTTLEEYNWLHGYLCSTLSDVLTFDPATSDPARLTRSPLPLKRYSEAYGQGIMGTQCLICEDWTHVYSVQWRKLYESWQNRPMTPVEHKLNRKLFPMKEEYTKAMLALLDGSFWSDEEWNGQRQVLFFPAYRLLRLMGYTHDQLWSEEQGGVLYNLSSYYHKDEIQYWRGRESSNIIIAIDNDVDSHQEDNDEE